MIYFDHAATTRVLPEAAQAAMKTMTEDYGNPSSLYQLGVQAAKRMGEHREQVARALGCQGEEVYFTSGGTEGDNWAVALAVHLGRHKGRHIITTAIEYAKRIGVVTAPTGAAVRDIMNISARRNPYVQLILYPAQVQGEGAKESIVRGIRMLEMKEVDVIIIGRGGGSIEDLWAFNEEKVARAIFDCTVPVISAVGHETDVTIADYVADLRAPTPSAAAELAVWDYRQVENYLAECRLRMNRSVAGAVRMNRLRLKEMETRLSYLHPRHKLQEQQQRLAELEDELRQMKIGRAHV